MNIILRNSIFNNSVELNGFSYIHFSLIYETTQAIFIQMYTDAIARLFKLLSLNKNTYLKITDGLTVEFSSNDKGKIHQKMITQFSNIVFLYNIFDELQKYSLCLPSLFETWENNIKSGEKTPKSVFNKIYKIIIYFIAVNYNNCIIETCLPQYLQSANGKKYNQYLIQDTFSHINFFNEYKNQTDILAFIRNAGFLANEKGEITEYENNDFLMKKFGKKISPKEIFDAKFISPDIIFQKDKIFCKDVPKILQLAKIMQTSLELRHYWMLRFARNLRIMINYDKTKWNTWLYKDYEKNLFDI